MLSKAHLSVTWLDCHKTETALIYASFKLTSSRFLPQWDTHIQPGIPTINQLDQINFKVVVLHYTSTFITRPATQIGRTLNHFLQTTILLVYIQIMCS